MRDHCPGVVSLTIATWTEWTERCNFTFRIQAISGWQIVFNRWIDLWETRQKYRKVVPFQYMVAHCFKLSTVFPSNSGVSCLGSYLSNSGSPWFSSDFVFSMGFPWFSLWFRMVVPWFSLWFRMGFSMIFLWLWFPMVFPLQVRDFLGHPAGDTASTPAAPAAECAVHIPGAPLGDGINIINNWLMSGYCYCLWYSIS